MNYYGPILINGMHEEDRSLTDLEIANLLQCLDAPSAFQEKRIVWRKPKSKQKAKGGEAR